MQAWGGHTYEGFRPSYIFPTRSAVVGLLGACLGMERKDIQKREDLNNSFELTVKTEKRKITFALKRKFEFAPIRKITDFHTIKDARASNGKPRKEAILSPREYLCDAEFTLVLDFQANAAYSLTDIKQAVQKPVFTPFLGRRSCPLHRPLFEKIINAKNIKQVLQQLSESEMKDDITSKEKTNEASADGVTGKKQVTPSKTGLVYSENKDIGGTPMRIRDIPIKNPVRQFSSRTMYICGGNNVS